MFRPGLPSQDSDCTGTVVGPKCCKQTPWGEARKRLRTHPHAPDSLAQDSGKATAAASTITVVDPRDAGWTTGAGYTTDGVHPNERGETALSTVIEAGIRAAL